MAVVYNQPCSVCGSSDAVTVYDDGHSHCYSCGSHLNEALPVVKKEVFYTANYLSSQEDFSKYPFKEWRGVNVDTMKFYDVHSSDTHIFYPYGSRTIVRAFADKQFKTIGTGDKVELFGQCKFPPASAGAITITEGALDAMSWFQMSGSKYPSVSIMSASTAMRDCKASYDYLNSFDSIKIMFDNDLPGKKAASEVAKMFSNNKVSRVEF